jgi:hypothetical protein
MSLPSYIQKKQKGHIYTATTRQYIHISGPIHSLSFTYTLLACIQRFSVLLASPSGGAYSKCWQARHGSVIIQLIKH